MKVTIELPEKVNADVMSEYSRQNVALELFKSGQYSIGYCADVADMPYEDFLILLSRNRIPMFTRTKKELLDELANA